MGDDMGVRVLVKGPAMMQMQLAAVQARLARTQSMIQRIHIKRIPLPIIKSSDSIDDDMEPLPTSALGVAYQLTQDEERLVQVMADGKFGCGCTGSNPQSRVLAHAGPMSLWVEPVPACTRCTLETQATQSSLNSAGFSLALQSFATGLLLTAHLATGNVSAALGDTIQSINKAVAAELVFVATNNFDKAIYGDQCDVVHLMVRDCWRCTDQLCAGSSAVRVVTLLGPS